MISTLLIISFGCLFNADLVRPESDIIEMPRRCFRESDCNSGEKCSFNQFPTNEIWARQGTCEVVSKVPSPLRKMRMCLLTGWNCEAWPNPSCMDSMGRRTPLLQVDVVKCEAYEICMPNRPDDTSNIGGAYLGMCQPGPIAPPPLPPWANPTTTILTTQTSSVGPTTTTEVRNGMNLCDPLMPSMKRNSNNVYELNIVICEAHEICQPLASSGELAKIGTCHPMNEPILGKIDACKVSKDLGRSTLLFKFNIVECPLDTYCKPFGDTGVSAMLGQCKGPTSITTRGPTLGPLTDPDTTTDYYVYPDSGETTSEEVGPEPTPRCNPRFQEGCPCPLESPCPLGQFCLYGKCHIICQSLGVENNDELDQCRPEQTCILNPGQFGWHCSPICQGCPLYNRFTTTTTPHPPHPPFNIQMCFVDQTMARSQMKDKVLLNIQIIQCKPDEICNPTIPDSEYYGQGLGNCILGDVVDVAIASGKFKTLVKIISDLGLVETLKNAKAQTIFAPSDEAFSKLDTGILENLTYEQKLAIVSRHVLSNVTLFEKDVYSHSVETLGGESIFLMEPDGEAVRNVQIIYEGNIINVVTPDVMAGNGVIHVIDKVILPMPTTTTTTTVAPSTPIVPGLNICIPNLFGRESRPIGQFNIVKCGANEVCQPIGEGQLGQYGTCKPTGEPELKLTVCLTGKGNGRSLPWIQFIIVECGPSEFCNPAGSSGEMATRGQCETYYNTTTVRPKVIELGPKLEVCILEGKTPIRPIGQMISAHVLGDEIELVECGIKESCVPFGPSDSYNLKDLSPALGKCRMPEVQVIPGSVSEIIEPSGLKAFKPAEIEDVW